MDVKVRAFKERDYWQVENLVRQFMNNDPFSPPIITRQVQDLFSPFFLVAYKTDDKEQEILGYIMGGVKFRQKNVGWVLEIFVKEGYRNCGIGDKLLRGLIRRMKKRDIGEIRLTVDPLNDSALKIYNKNGFLKVKCINEHYRKDKKVNLMKKMIS
jgi:ribosomal protein S18 acetylase RimI-like enzyme